MCYQENFVPVKKNNLVQNHLNLNIVDMISSWKHKNYVSMYWGVSAQTLCAWSVMYIHYVDI